MEVRAAYAFLLALSLCVALIPPLMRVAVPFGLVDTGGGRKVHAGQVPRIGGVAIFVGFLVPVLLWAPLRPGLSALLAATTVLCVFGVLDDRFNLDYRLKLFGQVLAALIVTAVGGVLVQQVPFFPNEQLPHWLILPFTVLALVGVTNAVNLSDGLDGLAGGIGLIAVCSLLLFAYDADDMPALIALAALLGALLGFLRFNTYPARLFMGDTGSQFLGFIIGALAVMVTQRDDSAVSPMVPILVLGLPILDMLTVVVGRVRRGASPFRADRTHLHHRLLDAGLSQYEAVSLVYGVQFLLVVLAYLLRYNADAALLLVYVTICALALLGLRALERHHEHLQARQPHQNPLTRLGAWARRKRLFTRTPFKVLNAVIPLFLVTGAVGAASVGRDIGVLAALLFCGLLFALLTRSVPFFTLERLSAYTTAVSVTYILSRSTGAMDVCPLCLPIFYGSVAVLAAVWLRFSSSRFQVSSLDVLILLGALVAPTLQGFGLRDIGALALEAIVLFYGIEILLQARERHWDALRIGVLAALAVMAVRGLLL